MLVYAMLSDARYCPQCAALLEVKSVEGVDRPVCSECGRIVYFDPKVTAATVVERDGKVLLVKRALEPGLGLWSLPGGYVDRGEVVERAAEREVLEETGLTVDVTDVLGVHSEAGHPVILVIYGSQLVGGSLKPGNEVQEVGFFALDSLPPLAFPRDEQILKTWSRRRDGHH